MNKIHSHGLHWLSVLTFVCHLSSAALILVALIAIEWIVVLTLSSLHEIHPFPDEILAVIKKLEIGVLYVDAFAFCVMLGASTVQLCKSIVR